MTLCKNGDGRQTISRFKDECRQCYQNRWYREHKAVDKLPLDQRLDPIGYAYAHQKVMRVRGKASEYTCTAPGCSEIADEWSYTPGDHWEQQGIRVQVNRGKRLEVFTKWSPNVWAYEPLCLTHHLEKDADA